MSRILALRGLAVAAWASCLAFEGLLAAMAASGVWHPHFYPVLPTLALVFVAGLAVLVGASWRVVLGPGRGRALAWLLLGAAPFWFVAGHLLHGYAAMGKRDHAPDFLLSPLVPLRDAVVDAESRLRYPQRTYGAKIVAISPPLPEAQARAETAAIDRHIHALEARLGRSAGWTLHWARGPILGAGGRTYGGVAAAWLPGEGWPDAEGIGPTDRHEVAHALIASLCPRSADAPAVLVEGWASANEGLDPIEAALVLKQAWERGHGYTLAQLTGADWYHRGEGPVYTHGGPLVDWLLRRSGPAPFLDLYTQARPATFDADCRRILGLDVAGLDAAFRAEVERLTAESGSIDRYRLAHLPLAPGVDSAEWRAFLAEYCAAADRLLAANRHVRLGVVQAQSGADPEHPGGAWAFEERSRRSGEFACLRHRMPGYELAFLSHSRRSILARRDAGARAWEVEDNSRLTPEQARRLALSRINQLDRAGSAFVAPLLTLAEDLTNGDYVVARCRRFTEGDRPRVEVRIEKRSPAGGASAPWRATTLVLAADDLFAPQSQRVEGDGPDGTTSDLEFAHDRHEGMPVLRSIRTATTAPDGSHAAVDLQVVERQFGPIPEAEFDPDRFLDGPQVAEARTEPFADQPATLGHPDRLAAAVGALCLVGGTVGLRLSGSGARRGRAAAARA